MQRRKYRTPGQRVEDSLKGEQSYQRVLRDNESLRRQLSAAKYNQQRVLRDNEQLRRALDVRRNEARKAQNVQAELRDVVASLKRKLADARPSSVQLESEHARALAEKNTEIGDLARLLAAAEGERDEWRRKALNPVATRIAQELVDEKASHKRNREALERATADLAGLRQELALMRSPQIIPPATVYALMGKGARTEQAKLTTLERRLEDAESRLRVLEYKDKANRGVGYR